jgi:RNA polymerase sigma-70 factor (ECF subfamily)
MKPAVAGRCGDVAFAEVVESYRRALSAVALDRIGRLDVAEDMAQEAITIAWEHRAELRDVQALPSWLFRIAVNCCLQWQRRESRWAQEPNGAALPARDPPILEDVLRRETIREVRLALDRLTSNNRIALLMNLYGYSYQEIADFLAVPLSTVRGRLARARERLRRSLIQRLSASLAVQGDELT